MDTGTEQFQAQFYHFRHQQTAAFLSCARSLCLHVLIQVRTKSVTIDLFMLKKIK